MEKRTQSSSSETPEKSSDEKQAIDGTIQDSIMRAAVHASRSGRHSQAFTIKGHTFPEVSKAFATYSGVKPCKRCKSNKQGAYHCRLRRQHADPDFDEGDSYKTLFKLLQLPMDELLVESTEVP